MTQSPKDSSAALLRHSPAWWRGAVIYQIYPRSFQDGNGDGIGDLAGVADHLDHVADLGADAIWIAPFFTSPMQDFGYDVSDYRDVDPIFGTLADFDRVVERAHALGLKVLIDQVWSHTSDRHPWFVESCVDPGGPKGDWYVWSEPKPDGSPPNNWLSVFGGPAWRWEPRRRRYYLHHFLSSQPALNLRNPAVLDAVLDAGRFWLDRGVDGFRLDAVDFMLHDPDLRSNPPAPRPAEGDYPVKLFGMQRHLYDTTQSGVVDLAERIRALMDEYPGTTTVAELSSQPGALARAAAYTSGGTRFHMAYTLDIMRRPFTPEALRQSIAEAEAHFDEEGWLCWAFSNHDVERVASRWGDGSPRFAKLALALLLSLRGSACLYQGEELGLTEAEVPYERLRDPFGINFWPQFKGRDGSRTPMPWRARERHAGFSEAEPWLPMPEAHHALAVDRQQADPDSVLSFCRRFLSWRRSRPEMVAGSMHLAGGGGPVVAFERRLTDARLGERRLLCLFNTAREPHSVPLAPGWALIGDPGCDARAGEDGVLLEGWGVAFLSYDPEALGVTAGDSLART
ncbi:alpha-amylase family glycosyl hydrolase [Telmatospirillum sp. J64-1]|uniref:alpha-amylase family glycosyl hydrolase n=1 Tax=Telmatospirillum sp. J64-1 TaxID=2502183 RepID=UPI001C8F3A6D|nr:alpha-amylase family glycosyl hydrolase [Telmatospirillum sp. J64-1]